MEPVSDYNKFKGLQNEVKKWLSLDDWHYFITFNFNTPKANLITGRKKLKDFGAKIDRIICGKHFTTLCPVTERTYFMAFPEHLKSNFHYHALLRSPNPELFKAIANDVWQDIVPSGDIFFSNELLHIDNEVSYIDEENASGIGNYITKEAYQSLQYGSYILSSEFSPQKVVPKIIH